MNKIIASVLVVFIGLITPIIAIAADFTNAIYRADIVVTNNGTATTNQSTIFTLNSSQLINQNFVNSALNNTAIINNAGADTPFMPGAADNQPWVVWVSSIGGATTNDPYVLYMGGNQSMQSQIRYFPGAGGMNVTDNASMELGGNFTINQTGFIDTSAGANKYVLYKPSALQLTAGGSSLNLSVNFPATTTYPGIANITGGKETSASTGHSLNLTTPVNSGDYFLVLIGENSSSSKATLPSGWTQLAYQSYATQSIDIWYRVAGSSENSTLNYTTNASVPCSYTVYRITSVYGISISVSASGGSTVPNPPSLSVPWGSANTTWIAAFVGNAGGAFSVISQPSGFNAARQDGGTASPFVAGIVTATLNSTSATVDPLTYSISPGQDWTAYTIGLQGAASPLLLTTLNATGVASGNHSWAISLNSSVLGLYVDGVLQASASVVGSVNNVADAWQFCTANATPYVQEVSITINGTQQARWTWGYSSTLPVYFYDTTGNGHTATPTMRTTLTSANVTANITTFSPISQTTSTVTNPSVASYNLTSNFTTPAGLYTELNITAPGAAWLNEILDGADIPRALVWFPIIFGFINLIGLGMYAVTKSVMIQALVVGFLLMLASVMGAFGFWVVIEYCIMALAMVIASKQFGW